MSLYSFAASSRFEQVPDATRQLMQNSLLDIIGIMAGASQNTTSVNTRQYAKAHYAPSASMSARLLFDGGQVHPLGAAWAGGFSADSLDAHEGHFTSKGHAGATVVPALLALADVLHQQNKPVSGADFLSALTVAYETALRAGTALMQTASDYHASGAFSAIGVVCGGARLLNMPEETFRHALGIAEYFAPRCPMMRLVDHPTMLRDAHGAGAYAGLNSLFLAQSGITGAPAETVEFPEVQPYWQSLGKEWEIDAQYFKPWPVCRWAQPALTAIDELFAQEPDLTVESIARVRVETFHESVRLQGYTPANSDEAQYGLAFPLAARLICGTLGPEEVTGTALHDRDILAFAQRIDIAEAEDLSARFPDEILSRVILTLQDGRTLSSSVTQAKGDPEKPMTSQDIVEKFHLFASVNLNQERRQHIVQAVQQLPEAVDCSTLLELITCP